jgi:AcrR family transcriptional regulator
MSTLKVNKEVQISAREKLLNAARDILIEEGHNKATIQKIAAKAGVNHGLVHHYFVSKEHLYIEVLKANPIIGNDKFPLDSGESEIIDYLMNSLFSQARLHVQFHIMAQEMPELREVFRKLLEQKRKEIKQKFRLKDEESAAVLIAAIGGLVLHYNIDNSVPVKESLRILYRLFIAV